MLKPFGGELRGMGDNFLKAAHECSIMVCQFGVFDPTARTLLIKKRDLAAVRFLQTPRPL